MFNHLSCPTPAPAPEQASRSQLRSRRHRAGARVLAAVITTGAVGGTVLGAAPAMAYDQGGVDPGGPSKGGFQQPGVDPGTPTPAPAPAPAAPSSRGSAIPAPQPETPPVVVQAPDPQTQTPVVVTPIGPIYRSNPDGGYSSGYSANPAVVLHAPRPTAPVRELLAPVGYLRVGNFIARKPPQLSNADAAAINANAAFGEAKIAQFWESVGLPKDQAARRAAAATTGGAAGAALGFVALGVPSAIVGGVGGAIIGAPVGALIGLAVPPNPINAGPGALIGLGVGIAGGAAGLGLAGGIVGAIIGGVAGAVVGDQVGAGDPGADPNAHPTVPGTQNERPYRADPPHPGANQFEVHLNRDNLPGGGKVDYVVTKSGDVNATASIGAAKLPPVHITAAQADAPYKAAGLLAQTARDTVARSVADMSAQAEKVIPGLKVAFPQLDPTPKPAPRHAAAHRR